MGGEARQKSQGLVVVEVYKDANGCLGEEKAAFRSAGQCSKQCCASRGDYRSGPKTRQWSNAGIWTIALIVATKVSDRIQNDLNPNQRSPVRSQLDGNVACY